MPWSTDYDYEDDEAFMDYLGKKYGTDRNYKKDEEEKEMTAETLKCRNCQEEAAIACKYCKLCGACREAKGMQHIACAGCATSDRPDAYHCKSDKLYESYCGTCNSCHRTCKCVSCTTCKRKYKHNRDNVSLCPGKSHCATCCKCNFCFKCRRQSEQDTWCNNHKACSNCCDCPPVTVTNDWGRVRDNANGDQQVLGTNLQFWNAKTFRFNHSKRFLAAEIEICGFKKKFPKAVDKVTAKYHAHVKTDGSLPTNGREINTAPANGDTWIDQILDFDKAIKEQDGWVDNRAGCHVHADARDFDTEDLRKVALVYAYVEPLLYNIVPDRKKNTYAEWSGPYLLKNLRHIAAKDVDAATINVLQGRGDTNVNNPGFGGGRHGEGYGGRYFGCNFRAFFEQKTLENRILHGSIKAAEIIRWGMLWADILDYAKATPLDKVINMHQHHTNAKDLLVEIASSEALKKWISGLTLPEVTINDKDIKHAGN